MGDIIEKFLKNFNFGHGIDKTPRSSEFHLHNGFEIYFFISGKVNYFIEKKSYKLDYCDCLVINNHEIHKPAFAEISRYERFIINFTPEIFKSFSPAEFDLTRCFTERPHGEQNRINLSTQQKEELLKLYHKLEYIRTNKYAGWEVLSFSCFVEILVLLNRVFLSIKTEDDRSDIPEKLKPILEYVEENLDGDLTLITLEGKFYINRFYLSRLFKNSTGSSFHEYILFKRISKAKMLLSKGTTVTDTCMQSGFGDYSNFIRMFKRTTGTTPGQYAKQYK